MRVGTAKMTAPRPSTESPEPDEPQATGALGRLRLLAWASRRCAGAPAGMDDAALLAIVEPVVVPSLGDICALVMADVHGDLHLATFAPAEGEPAQRFRQHLDRDPTALSWYAAMAEDGRARVIAGEYGAAEYGGIVAALGPTSQRDGLLLVGTSDPARQYEPDDLAAVEMLAALLTAQRTTADLTQRGAALHQYTEEMALAGRELAHALNNDLTMPVGVVELLLDRGGLSPELHEMLQAAAKDLATLERHIRTFHDAMRARSAQPAVPGQA